MPFCSHEETQTTDVDEWREEAESTVKNLPVLPAAVRLAQEMGA